MDNKEAAQKNLTNLPVKAGETYRHFKGGEYEIITIALKEDTLEPLVIYQSKAKDYVWARTYQNWSEEVEVKGKKMKRFELIKIG